MLYWYSFTLSEFSFYSTKVLSLRGEEEEMFSPSVVSSTSFLVSRQVHKIQQALFLSGWSCEKYIDFIFLSARLDCSVGNCNLTCTRFLCLRFEYTVWNETVLVGFCKTLYACRFVSIPKWQRSKHPCSLVVCSKSIYTGANSIGNIQANASQLILDCYICVSCSSLSL